MKERIIKEDKALLSSKFFIDNQDLIDSIKRLSQKLPDFNRLQFINQHIENKEGFDLSFMKRLRHDYEKWVKSDRQNDEESKLFKLNGFKSWLYDTVQRERDKNKRLKKNQDVANGENTYGQSKNDTAVSQNPMDINDTHTSVNNQYIENKPMATEELNKMLNLIEYMNNKNKNIIL
jgi:hypothetical protein